jgi:carbon-monoxide dehydrogenase large subunit
MSLAAAAPDAPLLYEDTPSNVCVDAEAGNAAAVDAAFRQAAHVVRLDTWVHRITGVPMEPRAAVGVWDPASGRYTVHAGAGGLGRTRTGVAGALGVSEGAVRVLARDVGGNFGTRNSCYPEFALVAWAARREGRPVKWTSERREAFLADYHGRDLAVRAELALDSEGHFLALRATNTSNLGADGHGLPRSYRLDPRSRRGHQHLADHAVPERGTPRNHVRDGAPDRPRRAPARLRST